MMAGPDLAIEISNVVVDAGPHQRRFTRSSGMLLLNTSRSPPPTSKLNVKVSAYCVQASLQRRSHRVHRWCWSCCGTIAGRIARHVVLLHEGNPCGKQGSTIVRSHRCATDDIGLRHTAKKCGRRQVAGCRHHAQGIDPVRRWRRAREEGIRSTTDESALDTLPDNAATDHIGRHRSGRPAKPDVCRKQ